MRAYMHTFRKRGFAISNTELMQGPRRRRNKQWSAVHRRRVWPCSCVCVRACTYVYLHLLHRYPGTTTTVFKVPSTLLSAQVTPHHVNTTIKRGNVESGVEWSRVECTILLNATQIPRPPGICCLPHTRGGELRVQISRHAEVSAKRVARPSRAQRGKGRASKKIN
ncbi:hypothetical protein K491DRAFT_178146 [Lophiostoma macrostomum CBS 122681]|uniref:Uncharacterized protein n=1 Tax=Lophiostoma macrostomum CBS 122681 TaxID=1314788 RepID=A0A6A6TRJ4_9PLEO|nr:hypothetical protein K491DRAFT_178146 [Lophiostoma macrostomum CBS 122681]